MIEIYFNLMNKSRFFFRKRKNEQFKALLMICTSISIWIMCTGAITFFKTNDIYSYEGNIEILYNDDNKVSINLIISSPGMIAEGSEIKIKIYIDALVVIENLKVEIGLIASKTEYLNYNLTDMPKSKIKTFNIKNYNNTLYPYVFREHDYISYSDDTMAFYREGIYIFYGILYNENGIFYFNVCDKQIKVFSYDSYLSHKLSGIPFIAIGISFFSFSMYMFHKLKLEKQIKRNEIRNLRRNLREKQRNKHHKKRNRTKKHKKDKRQLDVNGE